MKIIKLILILQVLSSCLSHHKETNENLVKEIYEYHGVDKRITFLGKYDPVKVKADTSIKSVIDFKIDSVKKEITYLDSILVKLDTINYLIHGQVITLDMYLYDLKNGSDEESIILLRNYNPFLIYNYPWGGYLFIISDSTEKQIMKKVIKNKRFLEKIIRNIST